MRFQMLALCATAVVLTPACGKSKGATTTTSGTGTTSSTGAGGAGMSAADFLAADAGVYQGSWELFAVDSAGTVSSAMMWTDVATTSDPTFEPTRAYLHVTDVSAAFTTSWLEG